MGVTTQGGQMGISPTDVAEYIRFHSCGRRLSLSKDGRKQARDLPFFGRLVNPIDPVLKAIGSRREKEWATQLVKAGYTETIVGEPPLHDVLAAWASLKPGQVAFVREVAVEGPIGAFNVTGRIDFLVLTWDGPTPRLRILEAKASRRNKTAHRIQLAHCVLLVEQCLQHGHAINGTTLDPSHIEAAVIRIDERSREPQSVLLTPAMDLTLEKQDVQRLLQAGGEIQRTLNAKIDDIPYRLESKCDQCVFAVQCFPTSALQARHELLGCSSATARALRGAGIADLKQLAALPPGSPASAQLLHDPSFREDLGELVKRAKTRITTLPGEQGYRVQALPGHVNGQLPIHDIGGERLIRVYLDIQVDYSEDRIIGLAAHVTDSAGQLECQWTKPASPQEPSQPVAGLWEATPGKSGAQSGILGKDIAFLRQGAWSGNAQVDTGREDELISQFFTNLARAIYEVAGKDLAYVHFYTWSRHAMTKLVEACSRCGSARLAHLRQLLGLRPGIEQAIFTSIKDETHGHFAFGWTSEGLIVATSSGWFGQRYHWTRKMHGQDVDLRNLFYWGHFDNISNLRIDAKGAWSDDENDKGYPFEIRAKFNDDVPIPYWHAAWGQLPKPTDPGVDANDRRALQYYGRVNAVDEIEALMLARTHALRWVEEKIPKEPDLPKTPLDVGKLRTFDLGVNDAARAAMDFLLLERHVEKTGWLARCMPPALGAIATGKALPIRQIVGGPDRSITMAIDTSAGWTLAELEERCSFEADSFVRIAPTTAYDRSQSYKQLMSGIAHTGVLKTINWSTGIITASVMPTGNAAADHFLPLSGPVPDGTVRPGPYVIHEGIASFVHRKAFDHLDASATDARIAWLDRRNPTGPPSVSLDEVASKKMTQFLEGLTL